MTDPYRIEQDGDHDDGPRDDLFIGIGNTDLREAGLQNLNDQHTDERADDAAPPAHQTCSADHARRDGRQLDADRTVGVSG